MSGYLLWDEGRRGREEREGGKERKGCSNPMRDAPSFSGYRGSTHYGGRPKRGRKGGRAGGRAGEKEEGEKDKRYTYLYSFWIFLFMV